MSDISWHDLVNFSDYGELLPLVHNALIAGAVLVAVLALVTDGLLALLQRYAVSPGISGRRTRVGPTDVPRLDPSRAGTGTGLGPPGSRSEPDRQPA